MAASEALWETARSLRLDFAAADVIAALRERGIRSILLKGRALQDLLYADGAPRPYDDVDLLVPRPLLREAGEALEALGFELLYAGETAAVPHAETWIRRPAWVAIDLHWTLPGVGAGAGDVWEALSTSTVKVAIGGGEAETLSPPATALLIGLHAAQHGPARWHTMEDLERALVRLDEPTWQAAAGLAQRLGAEERFAAGLRLAAAGRELADALGLPERRSVETILRGGSETTLSLGLEKLARTRGLKRKLVLVTRELFPSPEFMRTFWPRARAGRLWLALAYPRRLVWLALRLGPAFVAWRRAVDQSHPGRRSAPGQRAPD